MYGSPLVPVPDASRYFFCPSPSKNATAVN
jgi:hypothetical protein